MHLMPPLVRSAARGNPQGLSPRYRKDAPNLARPDCFFSFGFLLFLSRRRAVAVAKAEGGLVLLNPARHHAAQGLSRHSALREGGKSKVTNNAAEAKPDGKTKSPSGGMPEGPKIGTKKKSPAERRRTRIDQYVRRGRAAGNPLMPRCGRSAVRKQEEAPASSGIREP